ncbi:MAG: T9SS type A sorting domain-containing protein [bacterium]|nr:T9SS type A sorting domain-containing protein [bacterium]
MITGSGDIMVVYTSDWVWKIQSARSADNGATWQDPADVADAESPDQISGIRTAEGRVIAVWREWGDATRIMRAHSDDDGLTWSEPSVIEEAGILFSPTVTQSADGRLWLFYSRTWEWDSFETLYRISEDGGETWGPEAALPTTGWWASEVTLASEPGMPVIAMYDDGDWEVSGIWARALLAGGEWTDPPVLVTDPDAYATHPRAFMNGDGSQILVYTRQGRYLWQSTFDYTRSSIEIMNYSPETLAWGAPEPFTSYAGRDELSNVCPREGKPFIVFASDRWGARSQLYYGQAGKSEDVNPPPAFAGSTLAPFRSGRPVTLLAWAFDESAVSEVTYTMERTPGVQEGPFAMRDDGLTWDSLASDGIWGAAVGPFDPGQRVGFAFHLRDDGGNTVDTRTWTFRAPAVHDAGAMVLNVGEDGSIGSPDMEEQSAFWPVTDGRGYLYYGGFWLGADVGGEKRVSSVDWNSGDWVRVQGTPFTLGPGVSDQDVTMTYADTSEWNENPIGLAVRQKSFQWADPSRDDFVIFNYSVRNTGDSGDLDSLFAGVWLDPDVPWSDWENNLPSYDASRGLLILRNAADETAGWFGFRMLGPAKAPHSAAALGESDPDFDAGDDGTRYRLLAGGAVRAAGDTADYQLVLSAPPFSLASGDSFAVSFGIVLGSGLEDLRANADTMLAVYRRLGGLTAVDHSSSAGLPLSFGLDQNHPNPFNPATLIGFRLPVSGAVIVKVYDVTGREVAVLADRFMPAGSHRLEWNASGFGSGVYFCRIQSGSHTAVRKMVLMK